MTTRHTPGPWIISDMNQKPMVILGGGGDMHVADIHYIGARHKSDARLIAAAPRLLEALKAAFAYIDHELKISIMYEPDRVSNRIIAAKIARAISAAIGGE